jgi:hypothetical protein
VLSVVARNVAALEELVAATDAINGMEELLPEQRADVRGGAPEAGRAAGQLHWAAERGIVGKWFDSFWFGA